MSRSTYEGNELNGDGCDGCPLVPRREFLRDAGAIAAGILVALGASPARAAAAPLGAITATGSRRDEKSYPIPGKDGSQIDKDNGVIVTRWQEKVYVFSLACPHQNTAIRWYDKDGKFECPKHHSRFEPDGLYIKDSGRATRGLDRFAVRKDGNNVMVNLDKLYQEDEDETEWKAAVVTV
ncbi:MAG TPA: Rieske 2Fe-2S domain-containing protein [Gemmatimonadaceae bacterium]|jgi:Rieske Fe-S protein|nr:Rieske 2Fe-2S domain-containing protein [Gemmatimonadaceae bacterium]